MRELRQQSGQPGSDFRLAVAVDGVNALWGRSTIIKEDKSAVRKHIHNAVIPHSCLHAFRSVPTDLMCVCFSPSSGRSGGAHFGLQPEEANGKRFGENSTSKMLNIVA